MEFDYAVQCGLHIIALVHGDPGLIPSDKTELVGETRDKLDAFRDKVCADRMVKKWTSADELPGAVALSLNKAIRTHPAVGWVRADTVSNQELLEQVNQLQMHNMDLRVQVESLHKTYSTEIDDLAEGSETIELSGTYSLRGHSGTTYKWEGKFTWDMILGFIGPHLMMNYSEKAANAKLARAVLKNKNKNYDLISYDVNDEIFQTIKIQLLALKYIEVNPFPTTAKTLDLFWILTEKGKSQLLKVKSIKSSTDS